MHQFGIIGPKARNLRLIFGSVALIFLSLASTSSIFASRITATDTKEKGVAVAEENNERDSGWLDNSADIKMVLTNKHGQSSTRMIRYRTMEIIKGGNSIDGDKTLIVFDSPLDVKGTAFLTYAHKNRDDDQWLYLPTLKRVKRISARNKSGSFVGSEFAYEDISAEEIEKYTYRWLREEVYEGKECYVVERTPVDKKNTGYSRHIVWYDKNEFFLKKIDYYDRKDMLLKTLTFKDYEMYLKTFWRPGYMCMVNHQNGKKTELFWKDREFQSGLSDNDFNMHSLKRSR